MRTRTRCGRGRLFAAEGARVVIADVLEPEGRQLASELGDAAVFVLHDIAACVVVSLVSAAFMPDYTGKDISMQYDE